MSEITDLTVPQIYQELAELMTLRDEVEDGSEDAAVIDQRIQEYVDRQIAVKAADKLASAIRWCQSNAETCKIEADRIKKRGESWINRATRIKDLLIWRFGAMGISRLQSATNTLRTQPNGGVEPLEIYDGSDIPEQFRKVTITLPAPTLKQLIAAIKYHSDLPNSDRQIILRAYTAATLEPDNTAIREAIKRGEVVPGARLGDRSMSLRVE